MTRVPILMYHDLDEEASVISLRPELFAWQMRWLHEQRYRVLPLSELVERLRERKPFPARSVVITFDDGFESVYTAAYPVLARYGFAATVFLVPAYCGQSNTWPGQPRSIPEQPLLSWSQIHEMDRHGIEFGAHSFSHRRLDQLPLAESAREILDSKSYLEDRLGHTVELFSYPYGRYNKAAQSIVEKAFGGACSSQPGLVQHSSDPLALARVDIQYILHPRLFGLMSNPLFATYVKLRRVLRAAASLMLRRPWQ